MSKYKIYRTNVSDAKNAGKRSRWMYSLFFLLLFLLSQLPNYSLQVKNHKTKILIFIPLAIVIVCIVIFLFIRLKVISGSLKSIGTLELTKTTLKKHLGDLTTVYDYSDIYKIELENYFREVTLFKSGYFTRSLKITDSHLNEETLIISNKSIDFKQKIHIADSLKTLKKLTDIQIEIKNN